ncbi:MAG: hypothetical protein E7469_08650 [Ruminococcaceae bacterium]|nr:hypothetical protein [Oscillospiraceae bacterium]
MEKVILISIDGMRPDGFLACGSPYAEELQRISAHTLDAVTVMPSLTLPCHMSIFHGVSPRRHGVTTNTFVPCARPVDGIFEVVKKSGRRSSMHYGWEPLRDLSAPSTIQWADYVRYDTADDTDAQLTDLCARRIRSVKPDFVFLYLVQTDAAGHNVGWMTQPYLARIRTALDCVRRMVEEFGHEYTVIVTADHGGHGDDHGTDLPEDMTIPQFYIGPRFTPGRVLQDVSILDTAPTVSDVMGLRRPRAWEGRSLAE